MNESGVRPSDADNTGRRVRDDIRRVMRNGGHSCDGEDDVVVIGVIPEAGNPRRVWWTRVSERRQHHHSYKQQRRERTPIPHGPYNTARAPVPARCARVGRITVCVNRLRRETIPSAGHALGRARAPVLRADRPPILVPGEVPLQPDPGRAGWRAHPGADASKAGAPRNAAGPLMMRTHAAPRAGLAEAVLRAHAGLGAGPRDARRSRAWPRWRQDVALSRGGAAAVGAAAPPDCYQTAARAARASSGPAWAPIRSAASGC